MCNREWWKGMMSLSLLFFFFLKTETDFFSSVKICNGSSCMNLWIKILKLIVNDLQKDILTKFFGSVNDVTIPHGWLVGRLSVWWGPLCYLCLAEWAFPKLNKNKKSTDRKEEKTKQIRRLQNVRTQQKSNTAIKDADSSLVVVLTSRPFPACISVLTARLSVLTSTNWLLLPESHS